MRRRLSHCAATTIVAPMPVSLHLSRASGWLLHRRHLSRRVLTEEDLLQFRKKNLNELIHARE
jgi:hypothetical protein